MQKTLAVLTAIHS